MAIYHQGTDYIMLKSALLSASLVSSASAFAFLPFPTRAPGFRYPIAWPLSSMAERVLETPKWPPAWPYSEVDFKRTDENVDTVFYDSPRLVRCLPPVVFKMNSVLCPSVVAS
jgi:hypothetical protein